MHQWHEVTESVTDHLLNFLIIENLNFKRKIKEKILKRDFSKSDKEKLIKDFHELKINNKIDKMKALNEKYILLHENITCFWWKCMSTWDFKLTWKQQTKIMDHKW